MLFFIFLLLLFVFFARRNAVHAGTPAAVQRATGRLRADILSEAQKEKKNWHVDHNRAAERFSGIAYPKARVTQGRHEAEPRAHLHIIHFDCNTDVVQSESCLFRNCAILTLICSELRITHERTAHVCYKMQYVCLFIYFITHSTSRHYSGGGYKKDAEDTLSAKQFISSQLITIGNTNTYINGKKIQIAVILTLKRKNLILDIIEAMFELVPFSNCFGEKKHVEIHQSCMR